MVHDILAQVEACMLSDLESTLLEIPLWFRMIAQQRRDLAVSVYILQKAVHDYNDYNDNEVGAITRTLKLKEGKHDFDGLCEDLQSSMNVLENLKAIEQELRVKLDEVGAEQTNVASGVCQ